MNDLPKDIHGRTIPYSAESTPVQCLECPKFASPGHCGKCGCPSERLRPVSEILICPIKKFIRPKGWQSISSMNNVSIIDAIDKVAKNEARK